MIRNRFLLRVTHGPGLGPIVNDLQFRTRPSWTTHTLGRSRLTGGTRFRLRLVVSRRTHGSGYDSVVSNTQSGSTPRGHHTIQDMIPSWGPYSLRHGPFLGYTRVETRPTRG